MVTIFSALPHDGVALRRALRVESLHCSIAAARWRRADLNIPCQEVLMSRIEIEAVNRAVEDAVRKRDTERLATLYTADAIVMPPDAPFVKGRDNIKQFWGSAIEQLGVKDVRLNTIDLEIAGDTAHEVGEAVLTLESGGTTGKYVVVWKKVGGQWRLHRDIWNAKGA